MVNFVSESIPNVSEVTFPLRSLLQNDVDFEWGPEQDKSVESIKLLLSSTPVLKVFNECLPITLQCDNSKIGLDACLLQYGNPFAFTSRSFKCSRTKLCPNWKRVNNYCLCISKVS